MGESNNILYFYILRRKGKLKKLFKRFFKVMAFALAISMSAESVLPVMASELSNVYSDECVVSSGDDDSYGDMTLYSDTFAGGKTREEAVVVEANTSFFTGVMQPDREYWYKVTVPKEGEVNFSFAREGRRTNPASEDFYFPVYVYKYNESTKEYETIVDGEQFQVYEDTPESYTSQNVGCESGATYFIQMKTNYLLEGNRYLDNKGVPGYNIIVNNKEEKNVEIEPNNSCEQACVVTTNTNYKCSFDGTKDFYKTTLTENGYYQVDVKTEEAFDESHTINIVTYLKDDNGKYINLSEDSFNGNNTANFEMLSKFVAYPKGTEIYVQVYDTSKNGTGKLNMPYTLNINNVATENVEAEENDSKETATLIKLNQEIMGNFDLTDSDDWYKVKLSDAANFKIQFSSEKVVNSANEYRIYVYLAKKDNPDYQLYSKDYKGEGPDKSLETPYWGFKKDTEVYIRINGNKNLVPSYKFKLISDNNSYEGEDNDEEDRANTIKADVDYYGVISSDDPRDCYVYTPEKDGKATFTIGLKDKQYTDDKYKTNGYNIYIKSGDKVIIDKKKINNIDMKEDYTYENEISLKKDKPVYIWVISQSSLVSANYKICLNVNGKDKPNPDPDKPNPDPDKPNPDPNGGNVTPIVLERKYVVGEKIDFAKILNCNEAGVKYKSSEKAVSIKKKTGKAVIKKASDRVSVMAYKKDGESVVIYATVIFSTVKPKFNKKLKATTPGEVISMNACWSVKPEGNCCLDKWEIKCKDGVATLSDNKLGIITINPELRKNASIKVTAIFGDGIKQAKYKTVIKVSLPKLNKTKVKLKSQKTFKLKVKNTASTNIKFVSTDTKVATVSDDGIITAQNAGTTEVICYVDNVPYKCRVTVR